MSETYRLIRGARHYLGEAAIDQLTGRDPTANLAQARRYAAQAQREATTPDESRTLENLKHDGRAVANPNAEIPEATEHEEDGPAVWTPTGDNMGFTRQTNAGMQVVHLQHRGPQRKPSWRAGAAPAEGPTRWQPQTYEDAQHAIDECPMPSTQETP